MTIMEIRRLVFRRLAPDDQASARKAQKTGMTLEKETRDERGPFLLYSMTNVPSTRPRRPIEGEQR